MQEEIVFANDADEAALQRLLLDCGMDLAGEIEEHILIKRAGEILGGALLAPMSDGVYHLSLLAVVQPERKKGLGSQFLRTFLAQPDKYCSYPAAMSNAAFRVTTVARGPAAEFYRRNGFVLCDAGQLASPYDVQCDDCPERESCKPLPMVFTYNPIADGVNGHQEKR